MRSKWRLIKPCRLPADIRRDRQGIYPERLHSKTRGSRTHPGKDATRQVLTPKALHSKAQGRRRRTLGKDAIPRVPYAEGVTQQSPGSAAHPGQTRPDDFLTPKALHNARLLNPCVTFIPGDGRQLGHDETSETFGCVTAVGSSRVRLCNAFGVTSCPVTSSQGAPARPWAMLCNAFGVRNVGSRSTQGAPSATLGCAV